MEFPDQLKKPAPTRHPGFDALDDFLWDAASWDPDVEQALQDSCLDGTDRELAAAAQRLLDEGVLAEPGMAYRAMRLLADIGALSMENLGTRDGRPHDPMRPSGLAIGRETERIRGVRAVTPGRSGISMVCITGPAGVGKTRLAEEIAIACEQEGTTPWLEVRLSRAAVGAGLRQRAVTSHDALLDLLLQLGVAEADVPAIPADRKARYATALASQRPVILIDGAIDEQQVLDLLPPADGAVVVTSRRHLPGLFGWGAEALPLKPLSPVGSRLLIKGCFLPLGAEPLGAQPFGAQPLAAMPDDAVIMAISEVGRGMPVPTIAVSRWMATTARNVLSRWMATAATDEMPAAARNEAAERVLRETLAELSAALRSQTQVPSGLAQADEIPAFDAMAAVFRLLSADQRAVMQALGLLRLPETGVLVTCLATGLSEDRARAALEQLADMRLIARARSGQSWIMDPHVADYAHADALASGQLDEPGFGEMLGRVIDAYRTRVENLRDLMSAPGPGSLAPHRERGTGGAQPPEGQLHEWWAAEWEQERDSITAVLHAAAASARPALARDLAAAFMDAASLADGRESGWRETDSYMAPIMVIARAARDRGLEARVLQRFAGHTERLGDSAGADKLRNAATDVREARGGQDGLEIGQPPDHNATVSHDGDPIPVPAGDAASRDSLEQVERTVREPAVAAPGPVLFGAKGLWTVTGGTAGQQLALDELHEIESLTPGQPPAFRVEQAGEAEDDGWLRVEISLDCANVPVSPGHHALAPRERATLLIPGYFPFSRPAVRVRHQRFAGLPYVLGGHQICLYHSDSDWNPADGMFGVIARLAAWYRRAATGRLVEAGQPLHPPLALPLFDDTDSVVIHPDLPHDFEPSGALMVRRYPWRADVVKWLRPNALNIGSRDALGRLRSQLSDAARDHDGAAFLGVVKILHEPLSFEFPDNFPDLVTALSAQHVSRAELLDQLAQVWVANTLTAENPDTPAPLHVVIGAPMRGFAGADVPDTHLEVWQLDPADALAAPILTLTGDAGDAGDADLAAWLPAARANAQEWMRTAPLAWAYVQEDRRRIVTRRDVGRPAQWLLGKNVLVLGCGALGARIAEHCVRAGASRLTVADSDVVGPGVLVRQPYEDIDIGVPKARALADRLGQIRPSSGVRVVAEVGDIRRTILGSDSARPKADLIVDATASRGVSARIEWLRRAQPGHWPPILTLGVGHTCERAVGALALPHASGAGTDILQSFADQAVQDEALRDAAGDFFADPAPDRIFQPEIGCSEPTFTGSDPEVAAAAGQVFSWSLTVLSDHATHRPVSPKSLFFARMPGDRHRPAHVYLDWPNDVTADDERSGYQIRIRAQAMADMRAGALMTARLHPPSWETGGILLGYFDDACRVVWVTAAEGPPTDSQRGEHFFRHGTDGVVARMSAHHERTGGRARFAGMWHTHPGLSAQASLIDDQAMESLFVPVTATQIPRRAVRLILGGDDHEWTCWLQGIGQPEIGFRLFRRAQILALSGTAIPPPE